MTSRIKRVDDTEPSINFAIIQNIYKELNFPSSDKLKSVLKSRGIPFNSKEIDRLTREDLNRAVQGPTYKFNGKIASSGLDERWFIDLIDFTSAPSDGGKKIPILESTSTGKKYILVAQDVFSRKIWAEALPDKRPTTVAEGFRYILSKSKRKPKTILSDSGAEFQNEFEQLIKGTLGIEMQHKDGTNDIATLDNAIGQLKKALARVMRQSLNDDWSDVLQKVVKGQNHIPNKEYLEGQSPDSVEGNPELIQHLREKNSEFTQINKNNASKRRGKLENAGGFLAPVVDKTGGPTQRGWKPNFDDKVHTITELNNKTVADERGNSYDTRFVNPTKVTTATANPPSLIERPGSVLIRNKQREALRMYADQLSEKLRVAGTMNMTAVHTHISDKQAFQDAAAKVRLNKASLYKIFVNLFPELFTLNGNELSIKKRLRPMIVPDIAAPPPPPLNRRRLMPYVFA